MTSNLATPKVWITAFLALVLLFSATLTTFVTAPAHAATPLLDIAYSAGGNIWTQRADGTKTQLTSNTNATVLEYIPEASPDGLHIAYTAKVPLSTHVDALWIMGIDGSNPHQVSSLSTPITTSNFFSDRFPRWSPDGTRISFERDVTTVDSTGTILSGTSDIVVLDVASGSETTITSAHHNASGPAGWSPDGRRMVYWKTDTAGFSIIAADGSVEHPLSLQSPRYPSDPAWTADGNTIYFDTDSVNGILYFTSTDQFATTLNAPAKNLTTGNSDRSPHLTPDGKSVGFVSGGLIMTIPLTGGTALQQPLTGVTGFSFINKTGRDCAPLMFVGVRGSGETDYGQNTGGLGRTLESVQQALRASFPGMYTDTVNYTATKVDPFNPAYYSADYKDSLKNGVAALTGDLGYIFTYCKMSKIVLAGYSQGAHIAGDVYSTLTSEQKDQISAVLLFGDPRFNPKTPQVDAGTYDKKHAGIAAVYFGIPVRDLSKDAPHVLDICQSGDPICNYSLFNTVSCKAAGTRCPHLNYAEGWTVLAAQWAQCMVSTNPNKQNSCHRVRP